MFWTHGSCSEGNVQVTACNASFRNPSWQRFLALDWLWGTGGSGNSSHRGSQDHHLPAMGGELCPPQQGFHRQAVLQLYQAPWLSSPFKNGLVSCSGGFPLAGGVFQSSSGS